MRLTVPPLARRNLLQHGLVALGGFLGLSAVAPVARATPATPDRSPAAGPPGHIVNPTTHLAPTAAPAAQLSASRYSLIIDGVEIASFDHLEGFTVEAVPAGINPSLQEISYQKLTDKLLVPTVTLRRPLTNRMELWAWHQAVREGQVGAARRTASLHMDDQLGKTIAAFWLQKVWPSKISLERQDDQKAGVPEVLLETVTLVCESIQRVSP